MKRFFLAFVVFLAFGCARPPSPPPKLFVPTEDVENILEKVYAREDSIKEVEAEASVTLSSPSNHYKKRFRVYIFSDTLRFKAELAQFFGLVSGELVCFPESLVVYDPANNRVYYEFYDSIRLNPITGVHMNMRSILFASLGKLFAFDRLDTVESLEVAGDTYTIRGRRNGDGFICTFSETGIPASVQLYNDSLTSLIDIGYEGVIEDNGFFLPQKVTVINVANGDMLTMEYKNVKINRGVSEKIFEMDIPEDVERFLLE
ncbi:DUF4292 domain-containing protein [bacterium]|nr:DUF4292 domain-containing protein [bacterium]